MISENRIEKELSKILREKLKISKRAVDIKIENIKKQRGHDITRRDAALLLASFNGIDISKFSSPEKLREIRELKNKEYKIETKKTKTIEKDRILKIGDVSISSKEPFLPKKTISDAKEMSKYYSLLYLLENSLRDLIREVYNEIDYFNKKIPPTIRKEIEKIEEKKKYFQEKRKDKLEYAHLDFLKQIIVKNWGDFSKVIKEKDKGKFVHEIEKFMPERHAIAHTTRLKGLDEKRAKYKVEEILKMYN